MYRMKWTRSCTVLGCSKIMWSLAFLLSSLLFLSFFHRTVHLSQSILPDRRPTTYKHQTSETVVNSEPQKIRKWSQEDAGSSKFARKDKNSSQNWWRNSFINDYNIRGNPVVLLSSGSESDRLSLPDQQDTEVMKTPLLNNKVQPLKVASHSPASSDYCDATPKKSWKNGVLSQLQPPIKRNCELLRLGNKNEISRVKDALKSWSSYETEQQWLQRMSNCSSVAEEFSNNFYISHEEINFPLAYILIVYTNARQIVRLLKTIYRPHNLYCIHPDARQGEDFARVFRQISKCLDNVFVASKLVSVYYQHHTIMDSQLSCMEDLLKYDSQRWKYVINLCGRELPLKTNREIVSSLKRLKGASAVDSVFLGGRAGVWETRFSHKIALNYTTGRIYYTTKRLGPPPHHIKIYKSFNFIAATRPFVDFILHSRKAIDFRNYLKQVKIPEEHFYASLARLPEAPGGFPKSGSIAVPVVDQYIWLSSRGTPRKYQQSCQGKAVHFICILTVGDLREIYRLGVNNPRPHFFFNKYFMEDDHVVMDCMEERLVQQNMLEYKHDCG